MIASLPAQQGKTNCPSLCAASSHFHEKNLRKHITSRSNSFGSLPGRSQISSASDKARTASRSCTSIDSSFKTWTDELEIRFGGIEVGEFNGLRGMKATKEVEVDEELVSLPRSSVISLMPRASCPKYCDKSLWQDSPWYLKLSLLLLNEKQKGNSSKFAGYLQSLPSEVDTPMIWTEPEIEELQYKPLIKSIKDQRLAMKEMFIQVQTNVDMDISQEEFIWAMGLVRSRSFSGGYIGSKLSDRIIGASLVVGLCVVNTFGLGVSVEKTVNAALAVAVFNLLYEFLLSRNARVFLLVPGVDFMNHACEEETDLSYEYFRDEYCVRSSHPCSANDQVFVTYGKLGNDSLMQYYGFCLANNPYDYFVIDDMTSHLIDAFGNQTFSVDAFENVSISKDGFKPRILQSLRDIIKASQGRSQDSEDEIETSLAEFLVNVCNKKMSRMNTTLEDDIHMLERNEKLSERKLWALKFRIEKKKILQSYFNRIS